MSNVAENRRATFEYELLEKFQAGIVLTGDEIKSVRAGHLSLADCYGYIKNGECFLRNSYIKEYTNAYKTSNTEDKTRRDRKLLLHKIEIAKMAKKIETENLTLVPTRAYFEKSNLKVEICIARGKKLFDKREDKKKKDLERQLRRSI
ncbi:MAG: SsrA-binding protein SmpB [Clostridia bacterium]|nr:SsrA-binding protein SmpB [Clostridia bacterium]